MISHNFDPVIIDFGLLEIRWYSLSYILGIVLGWWYGKKLLKIQLNNNIKKFDLDNFDDLIGYIIIGIIFGGRLGYVIFYNPTFYLDNILEIFKIWKGGMSFHGGLIGVIISIYIFSKIKKLNFKIYFDTISCVAPIGIFFGRIANFINSELYGFPTDKPWGVIFSKVDNLSRHPSQIYEALLEGLVLFIILNYLIRKKIFKNGGVSLVFLIFYGLFRIFCEQFRIPDQQLGYLYNSLSMGSLLSLIMIILGSVFLIKFFINEKYK